MTMINIASITRLGSAVGNMRREDEAKVESSTTSDDVVVDGTSSTSVRFTL